MSSTGQARFLRLCLLESEVKKLLSSRPSEDAKTKWALLHVYSLSLLDFHFIVWLSHIIKIDCHICPRPGYEQLILDSYKNVWKLSAQVECFEREAKVSYVALLDRQSPLQLELPGDLQQARGGNELVKVIKGEIFRQKRRGDLWRKQRAKQHA